MVADVIAKLDQARAMTAEVQAAYREQRAGRARQYWRTKGVAWVKANPEKYAIGRAIIHARRRAAGWTCAETNDEAGRFIKFLYANQHKCPYCLRRFCADLRPTLDHIKPIRHGGRHEPHNFILACLSCNSQKSDSLSWPPAYRFINRHPKSLICDKITA